MCAIGDALLDIIVELSRLPVADDDVPGTITLTGGGQAANVAALVRRLPVLSAARDCVGHVGAWPPVGDEALRGTGFPAEIFHDGAMAGGLEQGG